MASALHVFLLVSVGLLAASADAQDDCCKRCPTFWTQFGERCFLFNFAQLDWATAEMDCIAAGGNLASMRNNEEQQFVQKILAEYTKGAGTWIGGYDAVKEGLWQWSDGSKFEFNGWVDSQPDNYGSAEHCMEGYFGGDYDFFNDNKCDILRFSLCSRDM